MEENKYLLQPNSHLLIERTSKKNKFKKVHCRVCAAPLTSLIHLISAKNLSLTGSWSSFGTEGHNVTDTTLKPLNKVCLYMKIKSLHCGFVHHCHRDCVSFYTVVYDRSPFAQVNLLALLKEPWTVNVRKASLMKNDSLYWSEGYKTPLWWSSQQPRGGGDRQRPPE